MRRFSARTLPGGRLILPAVFLAASALLFLGSCGAPAPASQVTLAIAAGDSSRALIDETTCIVVRCSSLTVDSTSLVVSASKSKSLKVTTLLFVPAATEPAGDRVTVLAVPVAGAENEYDLAQAKRYAVTRASAEAAASDFGIAYTDWQAGATSSADRFPCCE